jgi:hypothetical protein
MRQLTHHVRGVVAAMMVFGFAAEVHAAAPRGIRFQRRGHTFRTPPKPTIIDSSPTIDTLNKALRALGATDRDYDGHRLKAVGHIASAIHHLETPTARGKSNSAIDKSAIGHPAAATKTATTPQAASDESLRKAKAILFTAHHQLADHTASRGHIRADAEIRIAITEIVDALKPAAVPSDATAGASTTTATTVKSAR